jgi:hypothetical protein
VTDDACVSAEGRWRLWVGCTQSCWAGANAIGVHDAMQSAFAAIWLVVDYGKIDWLRGALGILALNPDSMAGF